MAIPRSRSHRIAFALLGGAVLSLFKLMLHCEAPLSAACVMGKRYVFVEVPLEAIIYGAGIFLILTLMHGPPES